MSERYDWMEEATQLAAQCWCDPETSDRGMDAALCRAVAQRIAAWMQTSALSEQNKVYWLERAQAAESLAAATFERTKQRAADALSPLIAELEADRETYADDIEVVEGNDYGIELLSRAQEIVSNLPPEEPRNG